MATAPSVDNYALITGTVEVAPINTNDWRWVGNCPEVEWSPELDILEHKNVQGGSITTDLTVVREKKGTLRIQTDELSEENMALAMNGELNSDGSIEILGSSLTSLRVRVTNQNDIGPKYVYLFNRIDFRPSGSVNLQGGEGFQTLEVTGNAATVNGSFGTIYPATT